MELFILVGVKLINDELSDDELRATFFDQNPKRAMLKKNPNMPNLHIIISKSEDQKSTKSYTLAALCLAISITINKFIQNTLGVKCVSKSFCYLEHSLPFLRNLIGQFQGVALNLVALYLFAPVAKFYTSY